MFGIKYIEKIEKLMPLCFALFFTRTVFIGYKYLFFVTFVPCFMYSVYGLFKQGVAKPEIKTLLLPVLVVVLFFSHFSPFSNVVRESVNIVLIVYFIIFSKLNYDEKNRCSFLNWFVCLMLFAGSLAILRFVLSIFGISIPLSSFLFEGNGYSLVNDYNFFSSCFIIAIILSIWQIRRRDIGAIYGFINVLISIINIGASVSRRAYALYVMFVIVLALICIYKKEVYAKVLLYNISILFVFGFCIIGLFMLYGGYSPNMSYTQKCKYYRLHTFIDREASFLEFDIKQSGYYYLKRKNVDTSNLFFNGDIQRYGLSAWEMLPSPHDCVRLMVVETGGGDSAIRVERGCSSGYWQLHYKSRPIVCFKDVTYKISFAYKVVVGPADPFMVGWWVDEEHDYHNLPQKTESIDSVWNRCTVSYKFQEDRMNPHCFLNSLQAGSIIEVKDIRLTCDDTTGLPRYVDQLSDSVIHKYYSQDTINYFTASRTDRWRYALELWQTRYNTKQKIFGQGFKYLEWYGEKFYNNSKRYDFPHNPIISSFLYSGIIGGIVYIIFLIMSLWLYWKRRKELGIFFIMYLCCMFFCMFSGSSHFSFPLFAFLSFMPFIEYKNDSEVKDKICLDNQ